MILEPNTVYDFAYYLIVPIVTVFVTVGSIYAIVLFFRRITGF